MGLSATAFFFETSYKLACDVSYKKLFNEAYRIQKVWKAYKGMVFGVLKNRTTITNKNLKNNTYMKRLFLHFIYALIGIITLHA